jgi:alkylation response protein AidB-like acyl-CoA dehydrogenase
MPDIMTTAHNLRAAFASRADDADSAGRMPAEDAAAIAETGYLRSVVPAAYGGEGLPMADCIAAHLELAKGSASTAIVAGMTVQLVGNEREQQTLGERGLAALCRAVVAGGLVNSAASEPDLGSPSRGAFYATTATPTEGGGWCINGHKLWVTGGRHLAAVLLKCSIGEEQATFFLPTDADGVRWEATWGDGLSLRASDSDDLHLEDVRLPAESLLRRGKAKGTGPNAWFPMVVASVYLGAALAARDALLRYALERVPTALGEPIATLPKLQRQIGEMDMRLQAARTLLLAAADAWDPAQREACYPRIAAAKEFATRTAPEVAQMAVRAAGGSAIGKGLPLERHFRDAQAGSMHPPAGDTALEIVGRAAVATFEAD